LRIGTVVAQVTQDELAALASAAVTDVRINVPWTEIEPRAGQWSGEALEGIASAIATARNAGLQPWLALLGRRLPPWFEDDGGFTDERVARAWPRYVERVGDHVGDDVAGWFPMIDPPALAAAAFAGRDDTVVVAGERALVVAWRDAWRILRGPAPVATAIPVDDRRWPAVLRSGEPTAAGLELEDLAASCDLWGAVVTVGPDTDAESIAERLVQFAENGPDRPLAVTAELGGADDEARGGSASSLVDALRMTAGDGVALGAGFAFPLLGADGGPASGAALWVEAAEI
jgi:hypothetical protein